MATEVTIEARKTALLKDLKSKGVTDLNSLVGKIIEANADAKHAKEPQMWYCNFNYCVYVKQM